MNAYHINNDKGGTYQIFAMDDVEFVNPIDHYKQMIILMSLNFDVRLVHLSNPIAAENLYKSGFFFMKAMETWESRYLEIKSASIPQNFINLLSSDSKQEQIKILRAESISSTSLTAFIFKAWTNFQYSYSCYRSELNPKGVVEGDIPDFIYLNKNDDNIEFVGDTPLTDGQLKNLILHRKVIIAKFIDRGANWHCFLLTYNSVSGREAWKNGQPHYHYISDKWNIPREKILEAIKNGYHPSTPVHIDLIGFCEENDQE